MLQWLKLSHVKLHNNFSSYTRVPTGRPIDALNLWYTPINLFQCMGVDNKRGGGGGVTVTPSLIKELFIKLFR